ncbi:D-glycero-alpha-D-manno-heptose-1,7-bisphosphate 7-phosphatase [Tellurirhabdus rosea]|uniref:D-glycero-alpha-D-manno-heptose-1,7-bisphosphate 7-phosphatase n=1 Tax=Tellurirhabdus rosea TaxID=2674997 RepID=UPI0022540820|nr:HAD family hydrolase [Tellurirhabdus rosea]
MNKCVFLDRDGVLNEDRIDYVYRVEDFNILPGVPEGLKKLKEAGYLLIVVTNQAGIAKGLYTREDVAKCHTYLQEACGNVIDAFYYCPHHPDYTSRSLRRKPDSLMLEKAIARYNIDVSQSWMFGDAPRDMHAGKRVGVRTVHITHHRPEMPVGDQQAGDLLEATRYVLEAA